MKSKFYTLLLAFGSLIFHGQTASNFSCNDCSGANRSLFTDLDAGKVVVITWVMPCVNCINIALSAQTEVQNALAAHPGKVVYYLSDDYGNTNCTTLSSWASTNGITDATIISNSAISMSPYGVIGMPKTIVVGGSSHKVFYNENAPDITSAGIKNGIDAAFAEIGTATGLVQNQKSNFSSVKISPNPSIAAAKLEVTLVNASKIKIEIRNELGQQISQIFDGSLAPGEHVFSINTQEFANGNYFVNFSDGKNSVNERLIVNH